MSTLQRIDDTLAYYSTGLNTQVVTPVEKPDPAEVALRELTEAYWAQARQWLAAFARFQTQLTAAFERVVEGMRPPVEWAQAVREARVRWVYRRWSDPIARATMWRRKAARRARA